MLKIAHITDLHLLAKKEDKVGGLNPYERLKQIVALVRRIQDLDCVIVTGDIAHHSEYEAYIHANELLKEINAPIFWLQGNHDFAQVMLQVANRVKIRSDKSFIIKDTKFILLQTVLRDEVDLTKNRGRGLLFEYELSFLKRELEEDNFKQAVIGLHHPPLLTNTWIDRRGLVNREEFTTILENYPKVSLVLYGHQHLAQQKLINGINYITSPPTSYHYNPDGEEFSLIDNKSGFGIISIDDHRKIIFEEIYLESN